MGFSEIIQHETFGPLGSERYKEYINDIHNSGSHLLHLINDVLDMSKIEAGRFNLDKEKTDLKPIINEALRVITPLISDKNIQISSDIDNDLIAHVDRRALHQIFLNLLSNAVKFTPSEGSIQISVKKTKNVIIFKVKDTGVGIPQTAIDKIGHPFEQVENQFTKTHSGSGLGLAISRSLIELHNGKLEIESEEGKGTTISVYIPL